MGKCDKLISKARRNPGGLRFRELCSLAECHGWEFSRQSGSHVIYKKGPGQGLMSFQEVDGMAKDYQVRQFLATLDEGSD